MNYKRYDLISFCPSIFTRELLPTNAYQTMKIHYVSSNEVEVWLESLGKTFIPGSQESFNAFEAKYLAAYDVIFGKLSRVASLAEDEVSTGADLSTSRWMEPQRLFGVVVKKTAFKPSLISAISEALAQLDGKFAVKLSKLPTKVYVFPGENILVRNESDEKDLVALGLK